MMKITDALQALRPGANWDLSGDEYSGLNWGREKQQSKPTENEINDWISANDYKEKREKEYPPIIDQINALMEGGDALVGMKDKINAIKIKYPKLA